MDRGAGKSPRNVRSDDSHETKRPAESRDGTRHQTAADHRYIPDTQRISPGHGGIFIAEQGQVKAPVVEEGKQQPQEQRPRYDGDADRTVADETAGGPTVEDFQALSIGLILEDGCHRTEHETQHHSEDQQRSRSTEPGCHEHHQGGSQQGTDEGGGDYGQA